MTVVLFATSLTHTASPSSTWLLVKLYTAGRRECRVVEWERCREDLYSLLSIPLATFCIFALSFRYYSLFMRSVAATCEMAKVRCCNHLLSLPGFPPNSSL